MSERVEVQPSLFAERIEPQVIQYTKVMDDGAEHKVNMFCFTKEQIDELRSHLPAAYAKIREERMMESWFGRLKLRWESWTGFDAKSLYRT